MNLDSQLSNIGDEQFQVIIGLIYTGFAGTNDLSDLATDFFYCVPYISTTKFGSKSGFTSCPTYPLGFDTTRV